MDKKEKIEELKKIIRSAEKEKHKLEKEIDAEKLPTQVGKYFKNKPDGFYFIKICKYDKEQNHLEGWSFTTELDWNNKELFTAEYLTFTSYTLLENKIEITESEFDAALKEYLNSIDVAIKRG